jgi:hypothetical protein
MHQNMETITIQKEGKISYHKSSLSYFTLYLPDCEK